MIIVQPLIRCLVVLLCLAALAGCASTSDSVPQGYLKHFSASDVYRVPSPDGEIQVQTIYRQPLQSRGKPWLYGVRRMVSGKPGVLVPTRFTFARATSTQAAIVQELGSDEFLRLDIRTGKTTPFDFETIGVVKAGVDAPAGFVGTSRQKNSRWTVTLLDPDARPVRTLTDVRNGAFAKPSMQRFASSRTQPVDYLADGAFVVHFDPPEGTPHAAIYDRYGERITPRFPSIGIVLGAVDRTLEWRQVARHTAVLPLDGPAAPERNGLVWPTRDDGTIDTMPDDLLGLMPIRQWGSKTGLVIGWLASWQTPQGPRWAIYPHYVIDPAELRATRDHAIYTEMQVTSRTVRKNQTGTEALTTILATQGPASDEMRTWAALTPYADGTIVPVYDKTMRIGFLNAQLRDDSAAARQASSEESKRRYDQEMARREQIRKEAEARAQAEAQQLERDRQQLDRLLADGRIEDAENLAWRLDGPAMAKVARKDPLRVSLNGLSTARYHTGNRQDIARWDAIINQRRAAIRQAAQPAPTPWHRVNRFVGQTQGLRTTAELNRQAHETRMDYLKGKTNWYIP